MLFSGYWRAQILKFVGELERRWRDLSWFWASAFNFRNSFVALGAFWEPWCDCFPFLIWMHSAQNLLFVVLKRSVQMLGICIQFHKFICDISRLLRALIWFSQFLIWMHSAQFIDFHFGEIWSDVGASAFNFRNSFVALAAFWGPWSDFSPFLIWMHSSQNLLISALERSGQMLGHLHSISETHLWH